MSLFSENVQILTAHGFTFDVTLDVWSIIFSEINRIGPESFIFIEFEDKYGATVRYRARDIVGARQDDDEVIRQFQEAHPYGNPS
jgi:hypothetical protein